MDDAVGVRGTQGLGNGQRHSCELRHRHGAHKCRIAERAPDDPFENQEGRSIRVTDLMDREDVGMVQGGQRSSLSPKPVAVLEIRLVRFGDELQRDIAAEHGVVSPVDRAHSAFADFLDDAVLAEQIAGVNGHDPILLPPSLGRQTYG